jgi:hypothetical protein
MKYRDIDFQKLNFTASSVGDIRKSIIASLLPCEIQFLKIYILEFSKNNF